MARIRYCENSTIAEAWTNLLGLPAAVDEKEAAVMGFAAHREIPTLKDKPAIVVVNYAGPVVPPFWNQQVTSADERFLARFGHRYLSAHFVRGHAQAHRYTTFDDTLKPWIEKWLAIYDSAFGKSTKEHLVDRVGFGYVNVFDFPPSGFDLSRYFKLNFGIDIGLSHGGLVEFNSSFGFLDAPKSMQLTVSISVEGQNVTRTTVRVATKVYAEKAGLDGTSFADSGNLIETVVATKEAAKETFFNFATAETHKMMKVVTDAGS